MHTHLLRLLPALLLAACGAEKGDSADGVETADALWSDYRIEPPSAEITAALAAPYQMPTEVCAPADGLALPEGVTPNEDGELCVKDHFNAAVPEGMRYTDLNTCDAAWSQGPGWFAPPQRVYKSPASLLDDEAYMAEVAWVGAQVEATGCACCHASAAASGHTSGFDMSAPAIWTDTLTNAQLAMGTGQFEEHLLFGFFDPAENHGFDRSQTLFPTTDPARMKAFFEAEFERRGGTDEDLIEAQGQFDALFGALFLEPAPCVEPYEGIIEGQITWNGEGLRQIYVLPLEAETPAFTPNLDLPAETLWAVYVNNDAQPIASGSLPLGAVPDGAVQRVPADGSAPGLVEGETYRLYGTGDIMQGRYLDCTFVYNAASVN